MKHKLYSKIPKERLEAYLDGTLDAKATAEIDALLDSDAELQRFVDEYINLQMGIANAREEKSRNSGAVDLDALAEMRRVMIKVSKQSSTDRTTTDKRNNNRKRIRWVASIACLLALGVVGYMIVSPMFFMQSSAPDSYDTSTSRGDEGVFDSGTDYVNELQDIDAMIESEESRLAPDDTESSAYKRLYEMKWERILLLKETNDYYRLQGELEEFVTLPGCHKFEAEEMWFDYFGE